MTITPINNPIVYHKTIVAPDGTKVLVYNKQIWGDCFESYLIPVAAICTLCGRRPHDFICEHDWLSQ